MFTKLARMFSNPSRIKLLKFFTLQPFAKATVQEAASVVGIGKKTAESELKALARAGVIVSRMQGKKKFFSLSPAYSDAETLRAFLEEITWPGEKTITDAFRGVSGVTLIVATGALARDTRPSIDLLVVTRRPKDARIKKAVRKVETHASFPLRYAVLEAGEYQSRRMAHDRLLRDVFEFSHRVVLGQP